MADEIDPLRNYANKHKEFTEAKAPVVRALTMIRRVESALRDYPHAVLTTHFGLPLSSTHGVRPQDLRFNMEDWPDQKTLRELLTAAHRAFLTMHEAWDRLSPADRQGVAQQPPKELQFG